MPDQPFFFLVSMMDDALMGHWTFRATDELAVMRQLLRDPWSYKDVFWGLRISLREIERVTPEELLQAINNSYGPAKTRTVLYLIRVSAGEICNIANEATPKLDTDRAIGAAPSAIG
jgi:hypothetical protein